MTSDRSPPHPTRRTAPRGLGALSPEAAAAARRHGTLHALPRGAHLVRRGARADALHLVEAGRMHVMLAGTVVAELAEGEPVGEIAFLMDGDRTADVVAARDSTILTLDRAAWARATTEAPALLGALTRSLASRLAEAAPHLPPLPPQPPRMTALIPAGGDPVPADVAHALSREMTGRAPLRASDANGADHVAAWLHAREAEGGAWLFWVEGHGRDAPDAWAGAVLRQTDAVVAVGRLDRAGGADVVPETPVEVEARRLHRPRARHLVLLRPPGAEIARSAAWLRPRAPGLHVHAETGVRDDLARAGRLAAGRGLGLVLSGGGALSCAHLGVARALREDGVAIDMMGGTSGGAAMGLAMAAGLPPDEILRRALDIFVRSGALRKVTAPVHAFLDHQLFDRQLREHYGTRDLVDFPRPVMAVSASLTRNEVHVHRDGPAWLAVRASGSLPGLLPPVITEEGEVLIDGGVLDNLPLEPMRAAKLGPNVAVALTPPGDWRVSTPYDSLRGRWALLRDVALRRNDGGDFPRLLPLVSRAMTIASRRAFADAASPDTALLVPTLPDGVGIMDWQHAEALERAGYDDARRRLDAAGGIEGLLSNG